MSLLCSITSMNLIKMAIELKGLPHEAYFWFELASDTRF